MKSRAINALVLTFAQACFCSAATRTPRPRPRRRRDHRSRLRQPNLLLRRSRRPRSRRRRNRGSTSAPARSVERAGAPAYLWRHRNWSCGEACDEFGASEWSGRFGFGSRDCRMQSGDCRHQSAGGAASCTRRNSGSARTTAASSTSSHSTIHRGAGEFGRQCHAESSSRRSECDDRPRPWNDGVRRLVVAETRAR